MKNLAVLADPNDFLMAPVSDCFARSDLRDTRLGIWQRKKFGPQPNWLCGGWLEILDFNFPTPLPPHGSERIGQSIRQDQIDRNKKSLRSGRCRNNYIERSCVCTERALPAISRSSNNRFDVHTLRQTGRASSNFIARLNGHSLAQLLDLDPRYFGVAQFSRLLVVIVPGITHAVAIDG